MGLLHTRLVIDDLFIFADLLLGGARLLADLLIWPGRWVRLLPFFRRREPTTMVEVLGAFAFWALVVAGVALLF